MKTTCFPIRAWVSEAQLFQVRSVVQYFAEQNKRILMLGRLHMSSFPKQNWSYITSHADVFLTESLSQDDPYLLYCALSSGVNTIMVSRDLMRGHIFRLRDPIKKILFNRWLTQCQHQLVYVTAQGKTFFRVSSCWCLYVGLATVQILVCGFLTRFLDRQQQGYVCESYEHLYPIYDNMIMTSQIIIFDCQLI